MTRPPTITAASRIAVWICTGIRSTKALARNAPGIAMAPIRSAKASTCAVTTPARPNTEILMTLVAIEITASGAITAAPSWPHALNSDSRMRQESDAPPTRHQRRQQDPAGAGCAADRHAIADGADAKPGIADPDVAALEQPAQRHAQ